MLVSSFIVQLPRYLKVASVFKNKEQSFSRKMIRILAFTKKRYRQNIVTSQEKFIFSFQTHPILFLLLLVFFLAQGSLLGFAFLHTEP